VLPHGLSSAHPTALNSLGMDVDDLLLLCKRTCKKIEREYPFKHEVLTPFKAKQFRKAESFFDALEPYYCQAPNLIIIALDAPGHWVALREFHGRKVRFLNNGSQNLLEDREFSLRRGAWNRIVQEETIVISWAIL
jgi:hypothetical protein